MEVEEQERWLHRGMQVSWSPAQGLMEICFIDSDSRGTGPVAQEFTDQVRRWTATRTEGFGMLVDCSHIVDTDPAWRAALYSYFRNLSVPVWIAWYNTSTMIRVMVEMFVLATPSVKGKAFTSEADARAYLRENGFG